MTTRNMPVTSEAQNDGALLTEFLATKAEAPFELLVERYGALVLGVCTRVLGNADDAEDAAQAVFLTLASKAASLTGRATIAGWLHRVAWHVAVHAQRSRVLQKVREREAGAMQDRRDDEKEAVQKLAPLVDRLLNEIPKTYREPLILHYFQGLTQEEAAAALGCPRGTVSARLTRGRELLRARLACGKVIFPTTLLGPALLKCGHAGKLSAAFVASTSKAAAFSATGKAASGAAAPHVVALSKGSQHAMLIARLKGAAAVFAAVVTLTVGAAVSFRAFGQEKAAAGGAPAPIAADSPPTNPASDAGAGIVTQIKVVSDKVPDVSTLEAWKASYIKDGMTDEQMALAIWQTVATFQHQDGSPIEYLNNEDAVTDALKVFNVYGHDYCGMASAHSIELARYLGLEARGWTVTHHVVDEIKYDNAWHLLDASLVCYFPKADGKAASVEELIAATNAWYAQHPGFTEKNKEGKDASIDAKLQAFHHDGNWQGWKKGPEIFLKCPTISDGGWFPANSHGWYSVMECYDGSTLFPYEMGFSQGYQVNIQLRKGEKLTRNWFHKNLCMPQVPGCKDVKVGQSVLAYSATLFHDLAPGRIGNGTLEYDVPLATGEFRGGALLAENLASKTDDGATPALHAKDTGKDGVLIIRMPSSYVYHTGQAALKAVVPQGGEISVQLSDNNGLDWKDVAKLTTSGDQNIDLKPFVFNRYDYRIKITFKGKGTGLDALKLTHDIQHSQRPLPALGKGENKLAFSAGKEGTVTIEGSVHAANKGKQLVLADFHPTAKNIDISDQPRINVGTSGDLTFPIETPGDMTRIRFGMFGRVHDKNDKFNFEVSFDDGKTFKTLGTLQGPARFASKFLTCSDVPTGARKALVRYSGDGAAAAMIFNLRIDADYLEPHGGFAPIKVTYLWEENGQPKQDVHIATQPNETYTIQCAETPVMKSIVFER